MTTIIERRQLTVSAILLARRAMYLATLSHVSLKMPDIIIKRFWTRESDLLDILINHDLGARAFEIKDRTSLRVEFFATSQSAEDILTLVLAQTQSDLVSLIENMSVFGLVDISAAALQAISDSLDTTRELMLNHLERDNRSRLVYMHESQYQAITTNAKEHRNG